MERASKRVWAEIEEMMQLACFTFEEQQDVEAYLCEKNKAFVPWQISLPTLIKARDALRAMEPHERRQKTMAKIRARHRKMRR